ncbi:MAG: type II toxin-antitoxin system RelE/ParE family toxin [Candidatus Methylomirabilia bacterium]
MPDRPTRTVRAVPRFLKSKRRLPPASQEEIDSQVRELIENPLLGEAKTGVLKGVRVVKFKVGRQQYLLACLFFPKPNVIEVLDVGLHENFYRDLQSYLEAR